MSFVSSRGESTQTKENEEEGEVRKSTPSYYYPWGGVDLFWRVLCVLSFLSDDDDDACVFFALLLFVRKKSDFDGGKEEEGFFRFGVVAKEKRWCARPAQQKRHHRRRAATGAGAGGGTRRTRWEARGLASFSVGEALFFRQHDFGGRKEALELKLLRAKGKECNFLKVFV